MKKNKKKNIGIIGLGYVGLPLAINFSKIKSFKVYGYDKDPKKIKLLSKGKSYINHIKSKEIINFIKSSELRLNFKDISDMDLIIICLPTPLTQNFKPDLSYIRNNLNEIYPYLRANQIISLESSTYPGTTEEIFIKKLKKKFEIGKNFNVIYSPEREDPGNKIKMKLIPKVLSGYSENCRKLGSKYYSKVFKKVILAENLKTAEFSKILENVFRSINIGLINEIKMISDRMGIDVFDIIKAASTKPFGFMPFYPGPGVGGHCIPLDPLYLTWKAKKFGMSTQFIELAHRVNKDIIKWILKKIEDNKPKFNIKKILIIGLSYKKNIDDCRESTSLEIINSLKKQGYTVKYHDPYVLKFPKTRKFNFNLKSEKISKENLKKFDAIMILTDHDNINYSLIKKYSKVIFDCRGRYKITNNVLRV